LPHALPQVVGGQVEAISEQWKRSKVVNASIVRSTIATAMKANSAPGIASA